MPEKASQSPEKQSRRFSRQRLTSDLSERAQSRRQELVFNRPDLVPYAELLSIAVELETSDDLGPSEHRHLRKMVSLEARRRPRLTKTPGDQRFWETIEVLAAAEWVKAHAFTEDLSDVPKSWQPARDDLLLISQNLKAGAGK